ncbi:cobW-domain-containing protein [Peniophora sp. CONT]|nr:cobW-domain-containing protein [Peniophora sp. CONT]
MAPVPVTVFTGFLGAGKTSIILNLLPQLPKDYKAVLLKNEFGDVEVDSQLAKQSSLTAVSEILNGCMRCCVLVGQMKTALLEILEKYSPDRIIIECSGSAFPATLAFQIRELERETNRALALDAIVTVIDAENFVGYEDTSVTARMQAQYTDLLAINKWESISERALDDVLEHLNTLNELTPKVRTAHASLDPKLIFGLDSKLFLDPAEAPASNDSHHEEVETATVWRGAQPAHTHDHDHDHDHSHADKLQPSADGPALDEPALTAALAPLSKETIYRVKGFVRLSDGLRILNWAFGRFELVDYAGSEEDEKELEGVQVRLTVMGERGEVKRAARALAGRLNAALI